MDFNVQGANTMSQRKSFCLTLLVAILTFLSACTLVDQPSEDPLDGTSWVLFAYGKTKPIDGTRITAEFMDGEIRGSAGCNSYFGSYKIDGNSIEMSEIGATLMACMEPEGIMEQEQFIMSFLSDAQEYRLDDGQLQIYRLDGEALVFISNQ
jgi:heat shock protein HslJ